MSITTESIRSVQSADFPQHKEHEETSVMVRVVLEARRANRFWQMLRDESNSDFAPFGIHESQDFPTHRLAVVEFTGKPQDVSRDLDLFPKYRFIAKIVRDYNEALRTPGISFTKTTKLDFADPELPMNKKKVEAAGSAFS
jgi:hypothetical protein